MPTEPDNWPADDDGHVLLSRAFDTLGKKRFPGVWSGKERLAISPTPVLPLRKESASRTDWDNAWHHLGYVRFDRLLAISKPQSWVTAFLGRVQPNAWTDADWSVAREDSIQLFEHLEPVAKRASAVRSEIARRCQSGDLVSMARPTIGGALMPIAPDAWETSGLAAWFHTCKIPLGKFCDCRVADNEFGWIFITANSLERVRRFRNAKTKARPYRSVYMRTMDKVISEERITAKDQSRVELLSAIFMEKLQEIQPPISEHLAKAMASLIREPESQLTRGGRPPNRPKPRKAPNRKS